MNTVLLLYLLLLVSCAQAKSSQNEDLDFTDHSKGSPQINRSSYFKQDFRLGYKLKLFCETSGFPRPQITWYHRGVEVNPEHNRTVRDTVILITYNNPQIRFSIHGDTVSSHLEIDPTSIGDKGEYECVATNSKGSQVKKFLTDYQY